MRAWVVMAMAIAVWLAAERNQARAEAPAKAATLTPEAVNLPRLWLGRPSGSSDSPQGCRDMEKAWSNYASAGHIAEADVYASMGEGQYAIAVMTLAAMIPNVGGQVERGSLAPALVLSWSFSLPFGPVTACRVARYSHSLDEHRSLRIVLEPGIIIGGRLSVFARPGLRAIWHRASWPIGLGAGLGSTLVWFDGQHGAASISPELLLHFGDCCAPGYFTLSVRADRYFPRREPDTLAATIGLTFW